MIYFFETHKSSYFIIYLYCNSPIVNPQLKISIFYLPVSRDREQKHTILLLQSHGGVERINLQSEQQKQIDHNG